MLFDGSLESSDLLTGCINVEDAPGKLLAQIKRPLHELSGTLDSCPGDPKLRDKIGAFDRD